MDTIEVPAHHLLIDDELSVAEAMRPSARELLLARRQLHAKAVVIGSMASAATGCRGQRTRH